MKKSVLRSYARLIACTGVNIQKGQEVFIAADLDQPEFVAMLVDECYKCKAKKVVVDLGGVEYISSAGLRVILTMVKASKAAAATLAFCSMQSMVAEVFKISGFSSMLPIYATRDEAVSALS